MSWINVVTHRHRLKNEVDQFIKNLDKYYTAPQNQLVKIDHTLLLSAIIAYGKNVPEKFLDFFCGPYKNALLSYYKLVFGLPAFLQAILPITILETQRGNSQQTLWNTILQFEPQSPYAIELQHLIQTMMTGVITQKKTWYKQMPVNGDAMVKLLRENSEKRTLDIALTPDYYPYFKILMADWILPLAYIISQYSDTTLDFYQLIMYGSKYKKHSDILYERSRPDPDYDKIRFDKDNSYTWPDIDAIEVVNDELVIHHWCTFKYKWPTIDFFHNDYDYDPSPNERSSYQYKITHNALCSWEHKEKSLEIVKPKVTEKTWKIIDSHIKKGRCKHIVGYAKRFNVLNTLEEELEAIRSFYGIKMEALEMMKI